MLFTLLLAACYDYEQDATAEEQPVDILSRFNAEGKAYLTIQIPIGNGASNTATPLLIATVKL